MSGYETRLSRSNDCDDMDVVQIEETIRSSCEAIARWWDHLVVTTVKARTTGTIGRTDVRPAPVSDYILDLQRTTCEQLAGWAMVIAEERGLWPSLSGSDGPGLAKFVGNHYDWLARHEAGRDAAGEVAAKAELIRAAMNPGGREETALVGHCLCGEEMRAFLGQHLVACACGKTEDVREVQKRAGKQEKALDHATTAVEIAATSMRLLGRNITVGMIREWAYNPENPERKKRNPNPLLPVGTTIAANGRTVPKYRIGDVVARYEAEKKKQDERAGKRAA